MKIFGFFTIFILCGTIIQADEVWLKNDTVNQYKNESKKYIGSRLPFYGLDKSRNEQNFKKNRSLISDKTFNKNDDQNELTSSIVNIMSGFRTGVSIWNYGNSKRDQQIIAANENNFKMSLSLGKTKMVPVCILSSKIKFTSIEMVISFF